MAHACADMWIAETRRLASIVPRWHDGYVSQAGIWAPTYSILPQDDASTSVSRTMYRDVMSHADRRVARAWEAPVFHLHSAGLHVADEVLALLGGRALNVVIDGSGPSMDDLVPILRHVQEAEAPLHVMAFSPADARQVVRGLGSKGLAVMHVPVP